MSRKSTRSSLSILCVTRAEPHVDPFLRHYVEVCARVEATLVLIVDEYESPREWRDRIFDEAGKTFSDTEIRWKVGTLRSKGFIESVLDDAIAACESDYILRVDDDETLSPGLVRWLARGAYQSCVHWKFPRVHLWESADRVIVTPHLWPDHQTRLSIKSYAGGRSTIHAGSPFGGGIEAPGALIHHKFLVRDYAARAAIVARYEKNQPGAGRDFLPFSCPEDVYGPDALTMPIAELLARVDR